MISIFLHQFSEAFGKLYGQSKHGVNNDAVEPSRSRGGIHENCIKYLVDSNYFVDPTFLVSLSVELFSLNLRYPPFYHFISLIYQASRGWLKR